MKLETKKNLFNIFLGFIPSSKKRKELRARFLTSHQISGRSKKDIMLDEINNNSFIVVNPDGRKVKNKKVEGINVNFTGRNSTVIIHGPFNKFKNCNFDVRNNSYIEIFSSPYDIFNLGITTKKNAKIIVYLLILC